MNTSDYQTDVLILGSGAAGLTVALRLPETVRVTIITKGPMHEGASLYAQGGISAVWDKDDSIEEHVQDTLIAGAGLCDPNAARFVAERSRSCIEWLLSAKVPFSTRVSKHGETELHLTREGGHSQRRIVHAADATGRAVETTLVSAVNARDNIQVLENHLAIDLITGRRLGLSDNRIHGAYILNLGDESVRVMSAAYVVLATGGASQVYLNSTTPAGATGDGIAMAWRAGARVANMEFNQFHPTSLYSKSGQPFLISEAVRGEGGQLKLPSGERFMPRFDDRAELAPRDIVARAIDHEMKRLGADCVYLDISHRDGDFICGHFPTIHQRCLEEGIDICREPIPVVPAAHYTCGGVVARLDGETDIPGLYAVGEVAYTGLHGANRLASNSLLECIVFATEAGASITRQIGQQPQNAPAMPTWDDRLVVDSDERVVVSHNWAELRRFMWDYVGIVRSDKRLARARRRIDLLLSEIEEYYGNFRVTADLLQLRNMATVADLIIRSAQARPESRGLHFNLDHPDTDQTLDGHPTILVPAPPRPYRQLK